VPLNEIGAENSTFTGTLTVPLALRAGQFWVSVTVSVSPIILTAKEGTFAGKTLALSTVHEPSPPAVTEEVELRAPVFSARNVTNFSSVSIACTRSGEAVYVCMTVKSVPMPTSSPIAASVESDAHNGVRVVMRQTWSRSYLPTFVMSCPESLTRHSVTPFDGSFASWLTTIYERSHPLK
jgi:hypothetical protein